MSENKTMLDWLRFSKEFDPKTVDYDFLEENHKHIFWPVISDREDIDYDFIDHFKNRLFWVNLSAARKDLFFFKRYADKIVWKTVLQDPPRFLFDIENFRLFGDVIDFEALSYSNVLNEDILSEFSDDLNWNHVMKNGSISDLIKNKYAPQEFATN